MDYLDSTEHAFKVDGAGKTVRCTLVDKECSIAKNCLKCSLPSVQANRLLAQAISDHNAQIAEGAH